MMDIKKSNLPVKFLGGFLLTGLIIILTWFLFLEVEQKSQEQKPKEPMDQQEVILPQPASISETSIEAALFQRRSIREYKDEPLTLKEISQILWAAQGITDPQTGKRTAPSAGALYPLKVYVMGHIEGLVIGMYQYNPHDHSLIKIGDKDFKKELAQAAYGQDWITKAPVNLIFTGNYGIIAKKYGEEKAPRYTHMEVGHAAQNVYLQARSLGLGTVTVGGFSDEEVKGLLNLPEEETPLYIMPVGKIK